jgi:hypothetical protein
MAIIMAVDRKNSQNNYSSPWCRSYAKPDSNLYLLHMIGDWSPSTPILTSSLNSVAPTSLGEEALQALGSSAQNFTAAVSASSGNGGWPILAMVST